MFSTLLGYWVQMRGVPKGLVQNLLQQFFTLVTSKIAALILISSVFMCFCSRYFGIGCGVEGVGVPRDWYTTCLCSFSPWAAQKFWFLKLTFFDMVTTQNDHPTYLKNASGSIYGFPPFFRDAVRTPRDWYTTCFCSFSP